MTKKKLPLCNPLPAYHEGRCKHPIEGHTERGGCMYVDGKGSICGCTRVWR